MPLDIHTSNRMENLVEALADVLGSPLPSPFTPEMIVVQSTGMQRWLSMELARRFGVWANCQYPFPNRFVDGLFEKIMPETLGGAPFDPSALAWRIMETLPRLLDNEVFVSLKDYLAEGRHELKLFQLAGRIADTYDQYTLFRGGVLEEWEKGRETHWQAVLWRALVAGAGNGHRWNRGKLFLSELDRWVRNGGKLPARVAVFGISWLPKFHLDILAAVSRYTEINLFVMSPCREYWADIFPARRRAYLSAPEQGICSEGNPLLSSFGRMGREFSEMLVEYQAVGGGERDLYRESPGTGLLQILQNDILTLVGPGATREKIPVRADDLSLRIHSCHGPVREVEVLHDSLLAMFGEMDDLAPRDILVMTPDIETYAPYISAVFEGNPDPAARIPFSIADRSISGEGRLSRPLLSILQLPGKRFPITRVMDILSAGPVHARFGLETEHLDLVRSWLEETRIRWGFDEEERGREGFPPYRENSWRAGLDRLLLGYAMTEQEGVFSGVLPYDDMEGDAAVTLGKFSYFVTALHGLVEELDRPRTLPEWGRLCRGILGGFFSAADEDADELAMINGVLDALDSIPMRSGYCGVVVLTVFCSWLAESMARQERGLGFLTGGVTFCAMLPMRSIPFRVIALLGMNDGAFPRQEKPLGFDLMAREKRPGDRSLRDEDRYLFLEALLSVRERLHISYTGQSIKDNTVLPPSVLVEELLDYLGTRFCESTRDFPASLVTRHRLQPFSPAYFNGEAGFSSYSRHDYRAVRCRMEGTRPRLPFFSGPLPVPPEEMREIAPADLLAFYDNPVRFLLRTRLGIRLDMQSPPLDDREPFELDALDAFLIRGEVLELLLDGKPLAECRQVVKARGILPPARQGDILFDGLAAEVAGLAERVRELSGGRPPEEGSRVDLEIDGFRISGQLSGVCPERLLRYRCGKCSGRDMVRLWIEHLILASLAPDDLPEESVLVTLDTEVRLAPVAGSVEILRGLLGYYWQGLTEPLKFFPRSSYAYAGTMDLGKALAVWSGDPFPEKNNPYYELCFGDTEPLDDDFEEVSVAVFAPLLAHLRK